MNNKIRPQLLIITNLLIISLLSVISTHTTANPVGSGWSYCAEEKESCEFNGSMEVAYGRDNAYRYQVHSNGVDCKNNVFGDPIPGRIKYCWLRALPSEKYITVDVNHIKQDISLMGGDMERSAKFLSKATNSQQIADWYYKDINFAYSRVSYDRQQELVEGNPNMAFYDDAIEAMQMVKNARPSVKFWATLKSDYDGYGTTNNLPDWIYTGGGYNGGSYEPWLLNPDKYARFLADYLQYMYQNGVPISVLSVSKEWQQVLNANREQLTIDALVNLLGTQTYAGVPIPAFSGPSGWGVTGTTNFINDAISMNAFDKYIGVSTHSYDNADENKWQTLIATANAHGKPVWHTESAAGAGGRYSGAEPPISSPISAFLNHCMWYRQGLRGELFFENWSRGVDSETRAVYFTNGTAGHRLRAYYIMKRFANHAADGNYIPSTSTELVGTDTMAFRRGNTIILWVINNTNNTHHNLTINAGGATLSSSSIDRLAWYNGSATSGYKTTVGNIDGGMFSTGIGPNALVSFVFTVNE